jgi:molecular chaperone GrpE
MTDKKLKEEKLEKEEVKVEETLDNSETESLQQKVEELENRYLRAVADYRNLEKRIAEDRLEYIKFANKEMLDRLLPSFDTLFLAEKYIQDDGLKLTIKTLYDAFDQIGVKRVDTVGKEFNPDIMECIETVEGKQNSVIEEVRPGFTLFEKTLRPAMVKVGAEKQS